MFFRPDPSLSTCNEPEYVVFTWVLCLIALATALKLYYLVKTFMALGMVTIFCILILVVFDDVFPTDAVEIEKLGMRLPDQMVILLTIFLIMVVYHSRFYPQKAFLASLINLESLLGSWKSQLDWILYGRNKLKRSWQT